MGWCPQCRYEYQPHVTVCPKCQVALVEELPPVECEFKLPPILDKLQAAFGDVFGPGLRLGREGARLLRGNPRLLLAAGLLATLCLLSDAMSWRVSTRQVLASMGMTEQQREWEMERFSGQDPQPMVSRWLRTVASTPEHPEYLTAGFSAPLEKLTAVAVPWAKVPIAGQPSFARPETMNWLAPYIAVYHAVSLPLVTLDLIILVGMLAWLSASANGKGGSILTVLRDHYAPLFILSVGLLAISAGLGIATLPLHEGLITTPKLIGGAAVSWLGQGAAVLLAIAPFAIVGRSLGAWSGIKTGVALLGRNWLALAGLFVLYRVLCEPISFAAIGLRRSSMLQFGLPWPDPVLSFAHWLLWLASAALGLWLAAAFTLVVREDVRKSDGFAEARQK